MSEIRLNPKSEFELEKLMTFFEALTKERERIVRENQWSREAPLVNAMMMISLSGFRQINKKKNPCWSCDEMLTKRCYCLLSFLTP